MTSPSECVAHPAGGKVDGAPAALLALPRRLTRGLHPCPPYRSADTSLRMARRVAKNPLLRNNISEPTDTTIGHSNESTFAIFAR